MNFTRIARIAERNEAVASTSSVDADLIICCNELYVAFLLKYDFGALPIVHP